MPYIGRDAQTAQSQNKIIDDISSSFNGSTTSFALLVGGVAPAPFPASSQNVLISVGGVIQEPDSTGTNGYQLTGANIVFSAAPASGQSFFGVILAGADYVNAGANFPDGDAGTPSITFSQDLDTGLFRSGTGTTSFTSNNNRIADFGTTEIVFNEDGDDINFRVEGDTEANLLFVDAGNDRVGIGSNSPQTKLEVDNGNPSGTLPTLGGLLVTNAGTSSSTAAMCIATGSGPVFNVMNNGNVGIGTDSPTNQLHISESSAANNQCELKLESFRPGIRFQDLSTGAASAEIVGDNSLKFRVSVPVDDNTALTERMRITADGNLFVNTVDSTLYNNNSSSGQGFSYLADSELGVARWQDNVAYFNRMGNDGDILRFLAQGSTEGNIKVNGSTVSLTGGHLSRWSQLAGGADRIEILRGSVLSNLDEMCEWGEEDNEQLNRMKVSDVEGDVNVAGVFESWDDDDNIYTNDFYCAMTGDFIIRIAQGTTVARGDLLMSAGDGTAKPQGDDIVRSKTIAKVTSTVVSETYADGSYCVPCVLMAC